MSNEEKKPEAVDYQIGLKIGKFVPINGFLKATKEDLVFVGTDGRFSNFKKDAVSAIIRDLIPGESFDDLKEGKKFSFEMYLESGGLLGFNGWKIEDEDNRFLTDKDDVVEILDTIIYSSYGEPTAPPEIKEKTGPKAVKD